MGEELPILSNILTYRSVFFGFTFNAILGTVIYGVIYKKPISFKKGNPASKIVVAIVVQCIFEYVAFRCCMEIHL